MQNAHCITPWSIFTASVRALIPNLVLDVGGTIGLYYILLAFFPSTSIIPLFGATLVPVLSIALSLFRHRRLDVIGIIVLVGLVSGIAAFCMGGGQRILLVRESFVSGIIGVALFVSPFFPKPIGYYVMRSFMSANEMTSLPFETLWEKPLFRRAIRFGTFFWGLLLLTEFGLRVFFALALPVVFALAVGPLILNALLLAGGALSALALGRVISLSLAHA